MNAFELRIRVRPPGLGEGQTYHIACSYAATVGNRHQPAGYRDISITFLDGEARTPIVSKRCTCILCFARAWYSRAMPTTKCFNPTLYVFLPVCRLEEDFGS